MTEPIEAPDAEPQESPEEAPQEAPEPSPEEEEAGEQEEAPEPAEAAPEPSAPEPAALSPKEIEARWKRIAKSAEVWRGRIVEVFGGDADMFVPCPMCESLVPGYVLPSPDTPQRFPAVREFMGDAPKRELRPDPATVLCETCGGWGEVATGSHVQGYESMTCLTCGGKGVQGERFNRPAPAVNVPEVPTAVNGPTAFAPAEPDPPEVAALKARGYMVISPQKAVTG